jgi:anti-sigma factor RsiW
MNEHDTGRLRAYLDGELSPEAQEAVAAHIDRCARCADDARLLDSRSSAVRAGLTALDAVEPEAKLALARFRVAQAHAQHKTTPSVETLLRSIGEMKRNALSARWRPAMIALSALLVVALLFTIAPVRGAAADFLGLFRIRKFAVIPLDQSQMERLEQLARQAEGSFGEPQILREEGPEQAVADAAQAAALAGYTVRTPSRLPDGATLSDFTVQSGPAMRIELDRAAIAAVMQAAGASTEGLPQTEKISAEVDVANVVALKYQVGASRLELIQMPSPQVNVPQGIDPVALAETGFMLLGMPQEDARRLATSIDWTSTLVVPMPVNAGTAREVTVDGASGLLLENAQNGRQESALLWEKDGILYFMASSQLDRSILLTVADSLQ